MVDVSMAPAGSNGVCLTGEWSRSTDLNGFFDLLLALACSSLLSWRHPETHDCEVGV